MSRVDGRVAIVTGAGIGRGGPAAPRPAADVGRLMPAADAGVRREPAAA